MSKRTDQECLCDIREAIQRVRAYTDEMSSAEFMQDIKTQDAVARNLEIIGEATKNLSDEFRISHSNIPWKNMAGTRDRLIHDYFGVNLDIVWQIISEELPQVATQIDALIPCFCAK